MKLPAVLESGNDIVLDTMVFIYFFENNQKYSDCCERLLEQAAGGAFTGIVTPVTAAELLVKPLQLNQTAIADNYRSALRSLPNIRLTGLSPETGFMAGALKAKYNLSLPDMIQVAAAVENKCPALISNDKALRRVEEVSVIMLDSLI